MINAPGPIDIYDTDMIKDPKTLYTQSSWEIHRESPVKTVSCMSRGQFIWELTPGGQMGALHKQPPQRMLHIAVPSGRYLEPALLTAALTSSQSEQKHPSSSPGLVL